MQFIMKLSLFTENLKIVIDIINMLLTNQYQTYVLDLKQEKMRLSHRF